MYTVRKYYDGGFESALGGATSGFMSGGPLGAGIGLASGLLPQIIGLFTAGKQRRQAEEANRKAQGLFDQSLGYANTNLDLSKKQYGLAQNAYNGRMAGAANLEQNIYGNQANTIGAMSRGATSASQLLALAGGVQGNTNDAFNKLAVEEAQNKQIQMGDLNKALTGVQNANGNLQNLYYDQSKQAAQSAAGLGQASQTNSFNALNGIGNVGMLYGMGAFGGNQSQSNFAPGMGPSSAAIPIPNPIQPTNIQFNPPIPGPSYNLGLPNGFNLFQQQSNPYAYHG
jgi:hypothetical protein